jgi:large subunit ribosomal protein L18
MSKLNARIKRGKKTKYIQKRLGVPRLVINRSNNNIAVSLVVSSDKGDVTVTSASTIEKDLRGKLKGDKTEKAKEIGKLVAQRALEKGHKVVAFDRSGYKFHGRVKAVADGAREEGLDF